MTMGLKSLLFCVAVTITATLCAKPVKIACVGNSVTYGACLPDRETQCYPVRLQELLGKEYEVRNFGHSGATLLTRGHRPYVEQQAYSDALAYDADVVVIHLGLNDTDPRNWPDYRDDFVRDYVNLIGEFRKVNPDVNIYICRMTPIFDSHPRFKSGTRDWFNLEQEAIAVVAEATGAGLIDLHTPLSFRSDLFPDALHPDPVGALILAQTVYSGITGDYGGLSVAPVYSSGMVVQRDRPIVIKGKANAGEIVTVKFRGAKAEVVAGADGRWCAELPAMSASSKGASMEISAKSRRLRFDDVLVGDVWLCSGQSNMAFRVDESVPEERECHRSYARQSPQIRLYNMKPRYMTYNEEWDSTALAETNDLKYYHTAEWTYATPDAVDEFSAVGFSFGRSIADSIGVPVGLICNAVGGSPVEAWIDRRTLETEIPDILADPAHNDMLQPWVRERAAKNIALSNNRFQRHPYYPAYLYEAGMAPLADFPMRGLIWYQGESNAHNAELFSSLFPMLVGCMKQNMTIDGGFHFVQLTSMGRPSWPVFRDTQRQLADELSGVDMAVIHDLGDSLDVHPRRKHEVGRRLALSALKDYGLKVEASGPKPVNAYANGDGSVVVEFSHAAGLSTSDGAEPVTFELARYDGLYYPAKATVDKENGCVILVADGVEKPRFVRYAWQPFTHANLVNGAGLPASTFRLPVTP